MLVISRNGKTTELTGWRAWIVGALVVACAWLLLALVVFVFLGLAITVGAILLLVIPPRSSSR